MKIYLAVFFLCMLIEVIFNIIFEKYYLPRKCKYNCDKCKNWKCYKSYCDRKRKELNKE